MEEALRSALLGATAVSSIAGTRIDWGLRPQGTPRPSIRLTLISRPRDTTYAGRSGLATARVQVDCFGDRYGDAKLLVRAVAGLVDALWPDPFQGVAIVNERDAEEDAEPDPIFMTSLDLMVWHTEA